MIYYIMCIIALQFFAQTDILQSDTDEDQNFTKFPQCDISFIFLILY